MVALTDAVGFQRKIMMMTQMNYKMLIDIYEETQCAGMTCCSDIDGTLDACVDASLDILQRFSEGSMTLQQAHDALEKMKGGIDSQYPIAKETTDIQ